MKNYKINYTDDERIRRVWDREFIRMLMSRRGYYLSNEWRWKELTDLWVRTPQYMRTASYGGNWGYYVGMNEIKRYYVDERNKRLQDALALYTADHPEVSNTAMNLGMGCMNMHVLNTPVIRLAGDGKTAQGMWYSTGQECIYTGGDQAKSIWIFDRIAADFVREEGEWRIWHLFTENDTFFEPGKECDLPAKIPEELDLVRQEFGHPTIPMMAHDNTFNNADLYPPIPMDYYSFSDDISYGPEGHPDYDPERQGDFT